MVEISCQYGRGNYENKVCIVIFIVTFDCHIFAFEFIVAIDIFDRLAFFIVISGQIIGILPLDLSDI